MNAITKLSVLITMVLAITGCAPNIQTTIMGLPEAVQLRDTQTVATKIDPKASPLTQLYERVVIGELKRPENRFHYDPKNPRMLMTIVTSRDVLRTGATTTIDPFFFGRAHTEYTGTDSVTVVLTLTKLDGTPIWTGSMTGYGNALTDTTKAAKCTRVLFDYFGLNESAENSCFR